jgi:DNA-binding CsgD family transcriptional regulator
MSDMRQRIESLSPRQFQILAFVSQHFSSKEIGQRLGLSPATVDSHIAAALQKLGLANRRDAAVRMIDLGFGHPGPTTNLHHGGEAPSNPHELSAIGIPTIADAPERGLVRLSRGGGGGSPILPIRSGMARVIVRYLLDGFYIILFFAVMSAVAFGAHWIVEKCEQSEIDPFVLLVLKWVSYMLVAVDGLGVVLATGLLTFRFIRATMRADD